MTAATHRRISPRGSVLPWAWAAVVALLAAVAVLLHHDMMGAATRTTGMSAMSGMEHTTAVTAEANAQSGVYQATQAATPAIDHDDGGACSGPAMQHCSSGDVGTPQVLAPPSALPHAVQGSFGQGVPTGHGPSGISHRAPPDLSVLSRLLI